jgi:DNA invertase Pin-like site-specific DNA recombinase
MTKCAIYIRVSTEEQRINGLSVETQKDLLTEYARKNNLEIVDYYIDAGLTARKKLSHRKEMQRLLRDVELRQIDLIIFTKLDRWFRNIADYYKVQEILDKNKANWKTIFEDYDTSTANGRLHINIMLSIAQDEADRTSERIKVVFENKRSKGETPANRAPVGYKIINSKLLIDEETKHIAIDIFNYYDLHHTIMGCVRMAREKYNYKIYDYSIRRMFENTIYIGEFRGIKNFCEPLISECLFNRINKHREVREFKNQLVAGRVYLFSSLIFCKECKHNMSCCFTIQEQKLGLKEFHYYRCKEALINHKCSHNKQINEQFVEDFLLNNLKTEIRKMVIHMEPENRITSSKKNDTVKIKKRLEKLKDLYLDDLIEKEVYKLEYNTLTAQLNSAALIQPDTTVKYKELLEKDLTILYNSFTLQERKVFWLGMIDKIIVDQDNNINFFLKK